MKNPVILLNLDSGEVEVYRDAKSAERSLEVPEIKAGLIKAFDRSGQKLKISIKSSEVLILFFLNSTQELASIEDREDVESNSTGELRDKMISYLILRGDQSHLASESLEGLILCILALDGFSG